MQRVCVIPTCARRSHRGSDADAFMAVRMMPQRRVMRRVPRMQLPRRQPQRRAPRCADT